MITTYHQLRNFILNNNVYLNDSNYLSQYQSNPERGVYYGRRHRLADIEFNPNEVTVDVVVVVPMVVIGDSLTNSTVQYKIRIIEHGALIINSLPIITSEENRRELQVTRFQLLNAFKKHLVEFYLDLSVLSFKDTIIEDFDPERIYPIYCRFLLEKVHYVLPLLKGVEEQYATVSYSPFDREELIEIVSLSNEDTVDYSHLTERELLSKLQMINYWITKIHYSTILVPENKIACRKFIISKHND